MSKAIVLFAALLVVTALLVGCDSEEAAPPEQPIQKGNVVHNDAGSYYVYTPPGYDAANSYPVLYLLNGFGSDEEFFKSKFSATDASVEMAVWNRWMANDCLARFAGGQAVSLAGVELYLDVGLQDDLGLNGAHQTFAGAYFQAFNTLPDNETYFEEIEDIFGTIPAGHVEQTWERLLKLLVWHSGQF